MRKFHSCFASVCPLTHAHLMRDDTLKDLLAHFLRANVILSVSGRERQSHAHNDERNHLVREDIHDCVVFKNQCIRHKGASCST